MSGSGRHFLAALAGLAALFTVFGLGLMLGAESLYPEKQRYQSYRYAADKPLSLNTPSRDKAGAEAFEYGEPCRDPKGSSESELCAQWRAAYAGENSAFWAKWSFWIGSFGVLGLLATIAQGRTALERARESNTLARDALESGDRPWVNIQIDFSGMTFEHDGIGPSGAPPNVDIPYTIKNIGKSPATEVTVRWGCMDSRNLDRPDYERQSPVELFDEHLAMEYHEGIVLLPEATHTAKLYVAYSQSDYGLLAQIAAAEELPIEVNPILMVAVTYRYGAGRIGQTAVVYRLGRRRPRAIFTRADNFSGFRRGEPYGTADIIVVPGRGARAL